MMIKIFCPFQTAKFNVKNMAYRLAQYLKGIKEKGGRTELHAGGSTRDLTSLIGKDLVSHVK